MYQLMNKDVLIATFNIEGEGELETCTDITWHCDSPFWIKSLYKWISERSAAKHRKHINDILEACGGKTLTGFIRLTHCLSLNDTLWIKSDSEDVLWKDMSLYDNEFNDVVAKLSFEGGGLRGDLFSTTSPEFVTDGAFDKCWIRENDYISLLKVGSTGASNAGREPYSEVLSSFVYEELCSGIHYNLVRYHGKVASKCLLFTNEKYGFKSAAACGLDMLSLVELLEKFSEYGAEDIFRGMIVADAVAINCDRHYGNFGFLVNNDTFELEYMAPVFDYNMAMFPYADWYLGFPDMEDWIKDRGPRLGSDYYSTAIAMMTPALRSKLINLRDLELTIECDSKFDEQRLKIVNRFKNLQIDKILGSRVQFDFTDLKGKEERSLGKLAGLR